MSTSQAMNLLTNDEGLRFRSYFLRFVSPLYYLQEGNRRATVKANGTCFFMQGPSSFFGVTARHVISDAPKGDLPILVGNLKMDVRDRDISGSSGLDVFTFSISGNEIHKLGKTPFGYEDLAPADLGGFVMPCGFPGNLRSRLGPYETDFVATDYSGVITSVGDDTATIRFASDDELKRFNTKIGSNGNWFKPGGMSGGPVFRVKSEYGALTSKLVGVISQGHDFQTGRQMVFTQSSVISSSGRVAHARNKRF
ncbi:hypothetical protein [Rhizobium sp. BK176]|uniref:hypothetical protein n=1 Tax=Rhizobium sp. BK176 TaxID=2587071 RepID=UPI00216A231A|nr:hypothetical protein [Rhizobium sp. BK176]MCS4089946.1 hypothetical protein [Rhizobium sp. BK176]